MYFFLHFLITIVKEMKDANIPSKLTIKSMKTVCFYFKKEGFLIIKKVAFLTIRKVVSLIIFKNKQKVKYYGWKVRD